MGENNMNVISSNKQNSKMGTGIIIGLLLAAVIGLGAYFVSKEFLNKDNKESENNNQPVATATPTPSATTENKETKKDLSVESDLVKGLYNSIFESLYDENGNYYYHKVDKYFSKELPTKIKMELVASKLMSGTDGVKELSEEEFVKKYHQMFGTDATYSFETVETGCMIISKSSDKITISGGGCGGMSIQRIVRSLYKAEMIADDIYIYEKVGYINEEFKKLYKDSNYSQLIASDVTLDKVFPTYNDKLDTYKYTFKSSGDGNYYFYSVEKVK